MLSYLKIMAEVAVKLLPLLLLLPVLLPLAFAVIATIQEWLLATFLVEVPYWLIGCATFSMLLPVIRITIRLL